MEFVYLVWHTHTFPVDSDEEPYENVKLLGVYSTEAKATDRIEVAKLLPGFREQPEGFVIGRNVIDRDEWTEGFVTVYPDGDDDTAG